MVGILRHGAYLPYFRLSRSDIAAAWSGAARKGEKAVASHDEDSLTLAVEAARDCLDGFDRSRIDGLFFASTTSPYREKQGASLIAEVLGLRSRILTADFAHSLRAATTALELARTYVESGRARSILVTAADVRLAHPGAPQEPWLGDGGAAFLVGEGPVGVVWEGFATLAHEMLDTWRTDEDEFIRGWEDRWAKQHGLFALSRETIRLAGEQRDIPAGGVDCAVIQAPDPRSHRQLLRMLDLREEQAADPLLEQAGAAGTAHPLLMLSRALEACTPGGRLLVCGYGDGADVMFLRATDRVGQIGGRRGVAGHLTRKRALPSYDRFLWYRNLVRAHPPPALLVGSSATALWRDRRSVMRLHGSRCTACGEAVFPIQRVCCGCRARDAYEEVPLAEAGGRLFTFTLDYLASQKDPPLIQAVVDLDPGCRLYTSMTDADADDVELEMPVEMTFRRFRRAEGFYNYFWKCRPAQPRGPSSSTGESSCAR